MNKHSLSNFSANQQLLQAVESQKQLVESIQVNVNEGNKRFFPTERFYGSTTLGGHGADSTEVLVNVTGPGILTSLQQYSGRAYFNVTLDGQYSFSTTDLSQDRFTLGADWLTKLYFYESLVVTGVKKWSGEGATVIVEGLLGVYA